MISWPKLLMKSPPVVSGAFAETSAYTDAVGRFVSARLGPESSWALGARDAAAAMRVADYGTVRGCG
jgi:hypothetical protein